MLIAHLSDAHIGPLPAPRLRELAGKRMTGWVNWRRGRSAAHDMDALDRICADIHAHAPDHIAFTGDVANIGLAAEFPAARQFLEKLGSPERVSFVPGNHDAYVRAAMAPLRLFLGPWMGSDANDVSGPVDGFPYVRRRDGVAFIGLSSGVPTLPFLASGKLGARQIAATEGMLAQLRAERLCRIIMIHHPPHVGGATLGRGLTDAAAFERMIRRVGAELVLHGHNHVISLARIDGPDGRAPVLGAPSASAMAGAHNHLAGYHLIRLEPDGVRSQIHVATRGHSVIERREVHALPPITPQGSRIDAFA